MKFLPCLLSLVVLCSPAFAGTGEPTAMELLKVGKVDQAIQNLNGRVAANPKDAAAYAELCRVYASYADIDNAIPNCERATQLKPDVARYHLWLGRVYGDKADRSGIFGGIGWAKKTLAEFERAVQLDPNDLDARSDLTEFYREAPGMVGGNSEKAHRLVAETEKIDPITAAVLRAQFALKDKDYSTAEVEVKKAVELSDGSAQYLLELARIYGKQKHWTDLEGTIRKAMESKKKRPSDVFDAADMLIGFGRNLNGAVELLRSYLAGTMDEQDPAFRAHFLIGRAYEKQSKKTEAAEEYRAALQLARNYRPAKQALDRVSN